MNISVYFVCVWRDGPHWSRTSSFTRFLYHTQRSTAVGGTPLDEWWTRRSDLFLISHNIHNRQTSGGIRTHTVSAGERPQTYALDRAATGTGIRYVGTEILHHFFFRSPCLSQLTCDLF